MDLLANILLLAAVPLFFSGWIGLIRGLWTRARGASVLGVAGEFLRLMKQGAPSVKKTGIPGEWGPALSLASVIFAGHFVPLAAGRPVVSVPGSLVLFLVFMWIKKCIDHLNSRTAETPGTGRGHRAGSWPGDLMNSVVPLTLILSVYVLLGENLSLDSVFREWNPSVWPLFAVRILSGVSFFLLLVSSSVEAMPEASGADRAVYLYCRGLLQMIYAAMAARAVLPSVRNAAVSAFILLAFFAVTGVLTGAAAFVFGKKKMRPVLTAAVWISVCVLAVCSVAVTQSVR